MKPSLSVEAVFADRPFLEGVVAAADIGFPAIEFWGWAEKDLKELKSIVEDRGLSIACFSGNFGGALVESKHRQQVLGGFEASMNTARDLVCPQIMCLTDELNPDLSVKPVGREIPAEEKRESVYESLQELAKLAESYEVTILLEPCNSTVDHFSFFLDRVADGLDLVRKIKSDRLKLLCDIYHLQVMEGNIIQTIEENIADIAHFHVADVPGRHQPGTGEINYANVLTVVAQTGYDGYVGLEMWPIGDPVEAARKTLEMFPSWR